ncbi:hypothetical protein A2971_03500 [Candidatus Gottesmanbacteria bacterium RIFCSPLOWO2_01_FULL_46_21]|uniref:Glycosyltransferase 2-like domain-containing protein n=1 Tax=Candidatus Gottesmanbacteria bacterium RIFCSPLOWO2_01_FULL_46_21 TaxID=1798393 RepID=A0A1F6AYS0_9BACT|nr:MAG: hypothetical protein A2971_03500 [Candidatus Gottesmanbacteria bacterium RIFCSPLOWO2_01_FULL_46_21]
MNKKPIISVIVPAYNEELYIAACLDSLKEQQTSVSYEIIVADNNSSDRTVSIAKKCGAQVTVAKQKGYAHTATTAISHAHGRIIAMTDADTLVPPLWLSTISEAFKKYPDVVAVGGPFRYYDGPGYLRFFIDNINRIYPRLLTATICGMNMAFRREAYQAVGGFSPDINLQADTYLGQKLSKLGKLYFLKNNTVVSSARRYRSLSQSIPESLTRMVNALAIRIGMPTLFKKQIDYR